MTREANTISAAFDAGVNFFFVTADMHWPLYEPSRRGLANLLARGRGIRDDIVVAGVCYPTQPEFCTAPFHELLAAIPRLDHLDVLLAGGAYGIEFDRRLSLFQLHRERGLLGNRAIGASFHDRSAAASAVRERKVDIAYIRYNPDHFGARSDVFPHLRERPRPLVYGFKSTYGYAPPALMDEIGLAAGEYWHPTITDHYRFALTPPEMDGVLIGLRSPDQVEALAEALELGPLSDEEEAYLMNVAEVIRGDAQMEPDD
jgi:aryl-alcohol dehydrogenase-like predicted oxidoreductase